MASLKSQNERDIFWMTKALEEAKKAMKKGEHPFGCVLVVGDKELARGQTSVRREKSITAHGEIHALKKLKWGIPSKKRPVILYTTMEPCLMCLSAAIQCGVDEIVFAMPDKPDGSTKYLSCLKNEKVPKIRGGVLKDKEIALMKEGLKKDPDHPGIEYAKALLRGVGVTT